MNHSYTNIYTV